MHTFKQLALAAALAVTGLTSAHANVEQNTFLLQNVNATTPGSDVGVYPIDSQDVDIYSLTVPTRTANDTFIDQYIISIPDDETVSFAAVTTYTSLAAGLDPTITFSGFQLYDFAGYQAFGASDPLTYDFTKFQKSDDLVRGNHLALTEGFYDLVITGTINVDGGSYQGVLGTVPTIPEPAGWALMLAGLAAMVAGARRRSQP